MVKMFQFSIIKYGHQAISMENPSLRHIFLHLFQRQATFYQKCFLFFQCLYTVVSYVLCCQLVVSYSTVSYKKERSVSLIVANYSQMGPRRLKN